MYQEKSEDQPAQQSEPGRAVASWSMGNRRVLAAHLFHHVLLVCSAGIVRRECAATLGGFDPDLMLMEDTSFHAFMIRSFGAIFTSRFIIASTAFNR